MNDPKARFATLGAALVPAMLLVGIDFFCGPPSVAPAATAPVALAVATIEPVTAEALDDAAARVASHLEALADRSFGPSPMLVPEVVSEDDDLPVLVSGNGAPFFVVQAIISSGSGTAALLDGRPYRVGDAFGASGWHVTEIDSRARSVTLADGDGGLVTRAVEAPVIGDSHDDDDADADAAPRGSGGRPPLG